MRGICWYRMVKFVFCDRFAFFDETFGLGQDQETGLSVGRVVIRIDEELKSGTARFRTGHLTTGLTAF